MFVAASTDCFNNLPYEQAIEKLADLEFSNLEICIDENGPHLRPSDVINDPTQFGLQVGSTRRLTVAGYTLNITHPEPEFYEIFEAIWSGCQVEQSGHLDRQLGRTWHAFQRRS